MELQTEVGRSQQQDIAHVPLAPPEVRQESLLLSPSLPVVVAFLLRMGLLWWIHRDRDAHVFLFFPTSNETWNVAHSLASGNGFGSPLAGMHMPTAWVAPGYPPLLAFALKMFGGDDYAATIFGLAINCLLSALTCLPIYAIGKKFGGRQVGLASSWLWVFLPTAVLFPLEWLWDQSFSAFLVPLLISVTIDLADESGVVPSVGYGVLWSIAAIMNPATAIMFPFLLVWLISRRGRNGLRSGRSAWIAVAVFVIGLTPWTVRNYRVLGKVVPIKDNFGLEFWLGNNPTVKSNWSTDKHPAGDRREMAQLLKLGEIQYMRVKQGQALDFIEAHPGRFLRLCLGRFVDTWTAMGDVPSDRWVSALHVGVQYIWITTALSLLALAGLFPAWRNFGWDVLPLAIPVVIFPATYYVTHSTLRYRHPIDPVITVLAAWALVEAYSYIFTKQKVPVTAGSIKSRESSATHSS